MLGAGGFSARLQGRDGQMPMSLKAFRRNGIVLQNMEFVKKRGKWGDMEYAGRDLGEYEITALYLLKQAYRDMESASEKVRSGAIAFFEDPEMEDIFSYRFIMEHFRELGFRPPAGNPFRPDVPCIEGKGGQYCFYFYMAICPKSWVSFQERLEEWERYPETAAGKHTPVRGAA